jgi:hypothetical protein
MSTAARLVRASLLATVVIGALPIVHAVEAREPDGVASCTPATRTGTYRVLLRRDGVEPMPGLLVLERAAGCLSALYITERSSVSLDSLQLAGDELKAVMRTSRGSAKVSLRFDESGITGTIAQGKKTWSVTGERTS